MHIAMLEPLGVGREEIEAAARPLLEAGHTLELCTHVLEEEEQLRRVREADVLVLANTPLPGSLIQEGKRLKMLAVAFAGVDHVDTAACRALHITVCNAAGYCTDAVAELTFGLILGVLRSLTDCHSRVQAGSTRAGLVGHELRGKTLGVVGTGSIGLRVAALGKAFGCQLLGYSRHARPEAQALDLCYVPLGELLEKSDIVSLHVPLTNETRLLLDGRRLGQMKREAILINTARGAVVDNEALATALRERRLAGAGIDVFEQEPPLKDHPLFGAPHALLAPHVGFATRESLSRRMHITFGNIAAWLRGEPQNVCQ